MPLVRELLTLTRRSVSVWLRHFPQLVIILGCGWIGYTVGIISSATLGTRLDPLPSILFALGVCSQVVSLILAIASLKSSMISPALLAERRDDLPDDMPIPREVFGAEKPVDIAISVIGPVLAVYAVWQLIDGMIRDGMVWNIMLQGYGNPTWSISLAPDRLPVYLAVGLAALALRLIWGRIARNRGSWWRAPLVVFEGAWTAMSFFILIGLYNIVMEWVWTREFYRAVERMWFEFIAWLPAIPLPIGSTLPEALVDFTNWVSETLIPETWMGIVLPLMWLSVTAMVFGWRNFDIHDLLDRNARERAQAALRRSQSWAILSKFGFVFKDARYKYLPLIHCWRLVWRAGVYVLGSFLILAAVLGVISHLVGAATLELLSRIDQTTAVMGSDLVSIVLIQGMFICLYAVTFDRGVKEALDLTRSSSEPTPPQTLVPPDPTTRLDFPVPPADSR